jgi:signal transduction histidine kinase
MPVPGSDLVDRLAALPNLAAIPREELQWLADKGDLEWHEAGTVVAPKGQPIETLWIILCGHISVRVDRGVGPRRVIGWHTGEVSGMLPYSRMAAPPGDNFLEERSELLTIHQKHFPEMIRQCPAFTAYTVHLMLDRARRFNASDLQDEKMISLGKLAAGLSHELNNPASAAVRGAKLLLAALGEADTASRALGAAALNDRQREALERLRVACVSNRSGNLLSPIERADRTDEIADWLAGHQCDPDHAEPLADTDVRVEALDTLAEVMSGATLDTVLRWIAVGCETYSLATDIEQAATRIHELVGAVKRFTQMDHLAGPESAEVESGLRDTVRVITAKARAKDAAITVDIEPQLPPVRATVGELNQIWLNLIDNALDAIPQAGSIEVSARREHDWVVVRVVDNGSGIPKELQPRIFDAFFTTKEPGEGIGLGLEITRRLVRRYQGDISVESRPGRTEFRVSLVPDRSGPDP